MIISARRAAPWYRATALGIAAAIAAPCAGGWAAARPPAQTSETGAPTDLVNRPGCWSEAGADLRHSCEAAGRR
ncbi:MAG TPA: hypothetical protein VEK73_20565 [Xanthobacteraceae bacterium]|nr:hypothetical protein [Xanthobacteraceae bacterium]